MDIRENIRNIILKGNKRKEKLLLNDDDSLLENGIIDSLKMIELISSIEKKYTIKVEDDELMPENFDSINAITNFIISKIS